MQAHSWISEVGTGLLFDVLTVGNTGVQLTVGRYSVLVDVGCGLGS
jgi:hypothetical protein